MIVASYPKADPFDQATAMATPTVAVPRHGEFSPVGVDSYRFLHAGNGMFLEARTPAVYFRTRLTGSLGAPYGDIEPTVRMAGGPVPPAIGQSLLAGAKHHAPNEWAGLVVYDHVDQCYRHITPEVKSRSPTHIDYQRQVEGDRYTVCVDVHSHGYDSAYFSPTDNADDIDGIYIAVVIGLPRDQAEPQYAARLVVYGHHIPIDWLPWENT